jgi:hypothetical protein
MVKGVTVKKNFLALEERRAGERELENALIGRREKKSTF